MAKVRRKPHRRPLCDKLGDDSGKPCIFEVDSLVFVQFFCQENRIFLAEQKPKAKVRRVKMTFTHLLKNLTRVAMTHHDWSEKERVSK